MTRRLVTDRERRARLAVRHAIHPQHRVGSPEMAAAAMTVLHATEPSTVHLSVAARTDCSAADVERALYDDRTLVKQLAMRRTLWAFPRDLLPAALGSASARVAEQQRRLLAKDVEKHGIATDGDAWLDLARDAVLGHLATSDPLPAKQIREDLDALTGTMPYAVGKDYGGPGHLAPRVLTVLGAEGRIVRAGNAGHWRTSRPTWTLMGTWLGNDPSPTTMTDGYAELTRRWLRTFGPGTVADLQWWLGATGAAVKSALSAAGAVEVDLERGAVGWVLPDDLEPAGEVEPWATLLPTLDPTTMGWKERGFYLRPERAPYLFDSNGNGGTTAWWDGEIVGAWVQDPEGAVQVVPCPGVDLTADARTALAVEAERLTAWLDGTVISNVYKSQLMKGGPRP